MSPTTSRLSAEHLLSGPRGRRLLLQFAIESEREAFPDGGGPLGHSIFEASYRLAKRRGHSITRFGWGPGANDPDHVPDVLPHDVARELQSVLLIEPEETVLRFCLAQSVDAAMYWQEPDGDDLLAAVPSVRDALARVAEWVASSSEASWLSSSIHREKQWLLHWLEDDAIPKPAQTTLEAWRAETIDREAWADTEGSAAWWSTPPHGLPKSCGSLPDGAPSGLWFVEDAVGWKEADARRIKIPPSTTIYEIHSPEDWAMLCRAYSCEVTRQKQYDWREATGRTGRWVMPDWARMAEHYDVVHLTYAGYLSAAGVPIPVDDDTASLIAGWNPDATYWLTDVEETGDPVPWRCHGYVGEGDWRVDGA